MEIRAQVTGWQLTDVFQGVGTMKLISASYERDQPHDNQICQMQRGCRRRNIRLNIHDFILTWHMSRNCLEIKEKTESSEVFNIQAQWKTLRFLKLVPQQIFLLTELKTEKKQILWENWYHCHEKGEPLKKREPQQFRDYQEWCVPLTGGGFCHNSPGGWILGPVCDWKNVQVLSHCDYSEYRASLL